MWYGLLLRKGTGSDGLLSVIAAATGVHIKSINVQGDFD